MMWHLCFYLENKEMLRKLACSSLTAVKIGALQILHFHLRLQWLLTPSHFSTLEFKVNLNKIKIPLIVRLLIIFVFQSPNIFSIPKGSCPKWEKETWNRLLSHSVPASPLCMGE